MHEVKGNYSIVECLNCKLIFINPQPTSKELQKHYPTKYYSFQTGKPLLKNFQLFLYELYFSKKSKTLLRLFFMPFKRHLRTIQIVPNENFLDVGCGSGNFLQIIKQLGFECYGVEPGAFNKKYAKKNKFKIFQGELHNAKYPSNFFSNITFNHVFEHVDNPFKVLKESKRILTKGGMLQITVPQKRSMTFWIFKKYWVQLDVPRHLFIYSESILREYAKKTGLKITYVRYNSSPFQFTGSLAYLAKAKNLKVLSKFFNTKLCFVLFYPLSFICNRLKIGDSIEITLTK